MLSQGSISQDELKQIFEYVGLNRILSASDWLERAENGILKEGDLCITFDDNLKCQYDVALPVLNAFGITAFWFIFTSIYNGILEKLEIYRFFDTHTFQTSMSSTRYSLNLLKNQYSKINLLSH